MDWLRAGLLSLGLTMAPMAHAHGAVERLGFYDPGPNLGLPIEIVEANARDCAGIEDLVRSIRTDAEHRDDVSSVRVGETRIPVSYDPLVLEYGETIRTTPLGAEHRARAVESVETGLELNPSLAAVIEAFPPERIVIAERISYPGFDADGFYDPYENTLVVNFDPEHPRSEPGTAYLALHEGFHLLEFAIDEAHGAGAAQRLWNASGGQVAGFVGHEGVAGSREEFYERHRDDAWRRGIMHCLTDKTVVNTTLRGSTLSQYANANLRELMAETFARRTIFPEESGIHESADWGHLFNAMALERVLAYAGEMARTDRALTYGIVP